MADPKHPQSGDLIIDASDIVPVDLTTDQIRALTKTREGFAQAIDCLTRLGPDQTAALGLNPAEISRIANLKAEFEHASELLGPIEKMLELVRETKMFKGHQAGLVLSEMANQARHRADKDPDAAKHLGALKDLFDYVFGPAQKGAASRADKDTPVSTPAPTP